MKILRIFLDVGMCIDVDGLPENYNFLLDCQTVRAAGAYQNGMIYIPADRIVCMSYGEQGQIPTPRPHGASLQ